MLETVKIQRDPSNFVEVKFVSFSWIWLWPW